MRSVRGSLVVSLFLGLVIAWCAPAQATCICYDVTISASSSSVSPWNVGIHINDNTTNRVVFQFCSTVCVPESFCEKDSLSLTDGDSYRLVVCATARGCSCLADSCVFFPPASESVTATTRNGETVLVTLVPDVPETNETMALVLGLVALALAQRKPEGSSPHN
jgi:hypothetical protein